MKITSEDALEPPASRRANQDGFYPGAIQARAPSSFTITVDCMSFRGFRFLRSFALIVCLIVQAQSFFPAMTKIVGTLGPRFRSVKAVKKGDTIFVG
ncbi:hypothetical protein SAY86_005895 [Trapa natans]|uniref:Uncharacterized protein n=1 Tax=Trapa natans TaxID=22666 RepID=A0AAN7L0R7_TRANT|nr:hypothetical protein SAY86_005895 [Trapa natans]